MSFRRITITTCFIVISNALEVTTKEWVQRLQLRMDNTAEDLDREVILAENEHIIECEGRPVLVAGIRDVEYAVGEEWG